MIDQIAKEVFPNYKNWEAFIELQERKGELENYWIKGYKDKLSNLCINEFKSWRINFVDGLNIYFNPIETKNRESLEVWIEKGFQLSIWINEIYFDIGKVKANMRKHISIFEDKINHPINIIESKVDPYIFKVHLSYNLDEYLKGDWSRLIYFADKGLPEEIIRIIKPILNDVQINSIFKELNENCKTIVQ